MCGEPGAARLEKGHDLAFVVGGAASDDDLARLRILGEPRREGRGGPFFQRVWRLHVVMAIEQDVARRSRAPPMADDHRLATRRLDARLKADVAQVLGAPFRRLDARGVIGWIGGDARDAQELEQPIERSLAPGCEVIEHVRQVGVRCVRLTHGPRLKLRL